MILSIESCYSFNGSLIGDNSLEKLKGYGYKALGLVDYSTSFFYTFYNYFKDTSTKPILGLRITLKKGECILYAINNNGYKRLLNIASSINTKNAIDIKDLLISKDIVYVLDSMSFNPSNLMIIKEYSEFLNKRGAKTLVGVDFSDSYSEDNVYPIVSKFSKTVIISRVKYINKSERVGSFVLKNIIDKNPISFDDLESLSFVNDYSLKSSVDFDKLYNKYPDLIKRTNTLIDILNVEIVNDAKLIKFNNKFNVSSDVYLKGLSKELLDRRLKNKNIDKSKYYKRLEYELSVIHKMGYDDYFLIVFDFIQYAKRNNIFVGPGRGSAASSLVSYALGIISVDPLEHNLLFERFLNVERVSLPDIDTDIESVRRVDVIKYLVQKYGTDHVSLSCVYKYYKAKGAISDVSNILGFDKEKISLLLKEIDEENTISSLLESEVGKNFYNSSNEFKKIIDIARLIEGSLSDITPHPSGIIISDKPINDEVEIHKDNEFNVASYGSDITEELGLLKIDLLSSVTLTFMHRVVDDIKKDTGMSIDFNKIDLCDKEIYSLINNKSLEGIFQFDTKSMGSLAKRLKVSSFNDICLCNALNRPGAMEYSINFINRKSGKEKIDYYDESIKDILYETYGIIIYQEQIMLICNVYSGFSLSDADILRKGIASKDINLINSLKDKFYSGANKLNRNIKTTERLFNDILKFSGYGFNKAHSVSYSYTAYYLLYLKAHFKLEFIMNLLKDNLSVKNIKECSIFGITLETPDLMNSLSDYRIVDNKIYMPFTNISGINFETSELILKIFNESNKSFEDFVSKAKDVLPKSVIESLIYGSCFDYTKHNKKTLIENLNGLYEFGAYLFDDYKVKEYKEFDFKYLMKKEKEIFKYNFKYHPIKAYNGNLNKVSSLTRDIDNARIVAYINDIKEFKAKNNDLMCSLTLSDEYTSIRGVIFARDYIRLKNKLVKDSIYTLSGKFEEKDSNFIIRDLEELNV